MPILDGIEATKVIRDIETQEQKERVPIIALTAFAMKGDRKKCIKNFYLTIMLRVYFGLKSMNSIKKYKQSFFLAFGQKIEHQLFDSIPL